jgi:hypothetical protein
MSKTSEPWFVAERSEALAGLLLTSRKDVKVRSERKRDGGVDLMVEVGTGLSSQVFVVQVKGTMSSDPNDWMQDVKQLFPDADRQIYLPACVFVINVRDNKAVYAWAAEPETKGNGARLKFHETGDFHPLDSAAVSRIIDQVKAYYVALPKQLTPA